jgi:hypothetical protein
MDYSFSDRISALKPSAIREILKSTSGTNVIPFSAGNPAPESFPVDIIKTNNEKHNYSLAAAAYKKHPVTAADGTVKEYLEMTGITRCSVIIEEQDNGFFKFGYDKPLNTNQADIVKGYLWEYPNNLGILEKIK